MIRHALSALAPLVLVACAGAAPSPFEDLVDAEALPRDGSFEADAASPPRDTGGPLQDATIASEGGADSGGGGVDAAFVDAALLVDAATLDAGGNSDVSLPRDASQPEDARALEDAGPSRDASTFDAGVAADAAAAADASGADSGEPCAPGRTRCGGRCVDTASDPSHCGRCDNACGDGRECRAGVCAPNCGSSVSFAQRIQPIFTTSCLACHSGFVPSAGLNLAPGAAYASLVNVTARGCSDGRKLVAPGNASGSLLQQKITGVGFCSGGRMPPVLRLSASDIADVAAWICNGAPNN